MSITVVKPFVPPENEFNENVHEILENGIFTNQGPMLRQLESELCNYLNILDLQYVTNGTVALQIALKALRINDGEIITTPFTYVATISSILWERCTPVFVDIEPDNFTIDSSKIEKFITPRTKAIMPVHVFGYACDIDKIQEIANKYNLKVIYDAAHTFGAIYKGKALCSYGDISTLSFHATKLFHTIEGGACVTKDKIIRDNIDLIKRFGHDSDNYLQLGINAKQDEFNAAMGLVNLKHINEIIDRRKFLSSIYDRCLSNKIGISRPKKQEKLQYNYAYYPIVYKSESMLLDSFARLNANDIFPRRYFYPSLNKLPYIDTKYSCPISEDISTRIACLPLYHTLTEEQILEVFRYI